MKQTLFARIASQVSRGIGTTKTSRQGLNLKTFNSGMGKIPAIQQNPETSSQWATLAKQGHDVVQFRDDSGKYVGVAVDGKVTYYPT